MFDCYYRIFGAEPKLSFSTPLQKGNHPELDAKIFLCADDAQQHHYLISTLHWAFPLDRIDIDASIMTMKSFRVEPRTGHAGNINMIHSCLCKNSEP